VGYAVTVSFCVAALWLGRKLRSDRARHNRRQAIGIIVGTSLLPAGILLMDRMSNVTWVLLVVGLATGTAVLILRS
jgi:hypothetical protein